MGTPGRGIGVRGADLCAEGDEIDKKRVHRVIYGAAIHRLL